MVRVGLLPLSPGTATRTGCPPSSLYPEGRGRRFRCGSTPRPHALRHGANHDVMTPACLSIPRVYEGGFGASTPSTGLSSGDGATLPLHAACRWWLPLVHWPPSPFYAPRLYSWYVHFSYYWLVYPFTIVSATSIPRTLPVCLSLYHPLHLLCLTPSPIYTEPYMVPPYFFTLSHIFLFYGLLCSVTISFMAIVSHTVLTNFSPFSFHFTEYFTHSGVFFLQHLVAISSLFLCLSLQEFFGMNYSILFYSTIH